MWDQINLKLKRGWHPESQVLCSTQHLSFPQPAVGEQKGNPSSSGYNQHHSVTHCNHTFPNTQAATRKTHFFKPLCSTNPGGGGTHHLRLNAPQLLAGSGAVRFLPRGLRWGNPGFQPTSFQRQAPDTTNLTNSQRLVVGNRISEGHFSRRLVLCAGHMLGSQTQGTQDQLFPFENLGHK